MADSPHFPVFQPKSFEALSIFDRYGVGDRDGRVEYPDIDPVNLELKFRRFAPFWKQTQVFQSSPPYFEVDDSKLSRLRKGLHQEAKEVAFLWNHFIILREKLLQQFKGQNNVPPAFEAEVAALVEEPGRVTKKDIARTFQYLLGKEAHDLKELEENFTSESGTVLGDSLAASMQFGTQSTPTTPETPPYLLPQLVLQSVGFQPDEMSVLTLSDDFPFSGYELLEPEGSFTSATAEEASNLLLGGLWISSQTCALPPVSYTKEPNEEESCPPPKNSKIYMAAIPGAALADALVDLDDPEWASPAQVFLNHHKPHLLEDIPPTRPKNLLESTLQNLIKMKRAQGEKRGGFFVVALGSNDLLTYRHIVIGAPERNAGEYEKDLEQLDEQTRPLVDQGVRRVFFIPPNVADAFLPLPPGARFTDGETIPEGSTALYHWVITAKEGKCIPRHVVLSPSQKKYLESEYINYREAIERVLIEGSNWLVLDNQWDLPYLFKQIAEKGLELGVPGYEEVTYKGYEAVFSPDNEHPSNFGYLIWSELIVQALRNRNVHLFSNEALSTYTVISYRDNEDSQQLEKSINETIERVAARIYAEPSVFRPRRLPYEELMELPKKLARLKSARPEDTRKALQRYWPFLSHSVLNDLCEQLGTTESIASYQQQLENRGPQVDSHLTLDENLKRLPHHVKAGFVRTTLNQMRDVQLQELWPTLFPIFEEWAEDAKENFLDQVEFAKVNFSAIGGREGETAAEYKSGNTPGFVDWRSNYQAFAVGPRLGGGNKNPVVGIEYQRGFTSNTAYLPKWTLMSHFVYLSGFLSGEVLWEKPTGKQNFDTNLSLQLFGNTLLNQTVQFELGALALTSPTDLPSDYVTPALEMGFSFWPEIDPAFEKKGFGFRVAGRLPARIRNPFDPDFDATTITGRLKWSF